MVDVDLLKQHYKNSFWSKVKCGDTTDDCWEWQAATNVRGYGVLQTRKCTQRHKLAHRVSFALEYGYESSLDVLHTCDNPLCVNPSHLYEGTNDDNIKDRLKRGYYSNGQVIRRHIQQSELDEMKRLRKLGLSYRAIAGCVGVSVSQTYTILNGGRKIG